MPRGIIVTAVLILALMVAAKDGRLPRKAGLTASCIVAQQESDGGGGEPVCSNEGTYWMRGRPE